MVTRIVKMTFRNDESERFIAIFNKYHEHIGNADGCLSLQLLRDLENPGVFFTYSRWEHPSFLEKYRQSDLFGEVWSQVKPLFSDPAQAWSTQLLDESSIDSE